MANAITILRLIFLPLAIFLMSEGYRLESALVVGAAGISDGLDGWVARKWSTVTEFGTILDPVVDRFFLAGISISVFIVTGFPPLVFLILLFLRDLFLMGAYRFAFKSGGSRPAVNFTGKTGTALLMVALPFLIMEWSFARPLFYVGFVLLMIAGLQYVRDYYSAQGEKELINI